MRIGEWCRICLARRICLKKPPAPWPSEVREELSGNLQRRLCNHLREHLTTYRKESKDFEDKAGTAKEFLGRASECSVGFNNFREVLDDLKEELGREERIHIYREEVALLQDDLGNAGNLLHSLGALAAAVEQAHNDLLSRKRRHEEILADVQGGIEFVEEVLRYLKETAPCSFVDSAP